MSNREDIFCPECNEIICECEVESHDTITGEIMDDDYCPDCGIPRIDGCECDDLGDEQEDKTLREAKKFLGLIEAFDTTADGLEDNLIKEKEKINKELEIIDDIPEVLNSTLISSDELLSDFVLVRQSLRDDIIATRILLKKLSEDMSGTHADDLSGAMVMAYAELKKGNVTSMKLLMDSYSSVAETQLKVKKLITEIQSIENQEDTESGTINVQNNFIGTTADILAKLKKK